MLCPRICNEVLTNIVMPLRIGYGGVLLLEGLYDTAANPPQYDERYCPKRLHLS